MDEILINEIAEQPKIIQNLIDSEFNHIKNIAQSFQNKFDHMLIAARGTSDNAARYAKYILGSFNQIPVGLATPSLYTIYEKPPVLNNTLVVGISQSGQSPDILSVIETAKKQGQITLCITNDANSPLGKMADYVIPLHCGKERSVAATKTYTSSLTAIAMLSIALAEDQERERSLKSIAPFLEKTIKASQDIISKTSRYRYIEHCVVIGRGYNYATAFEIALKIKELTKVVSVPYSSADFKHGPIAAVQPGFPVVMIAPSGKILEQMKDFAKKMHELDAELISISDDEEIISNSNLGFKIPDGIVEWLSPIACAIPGQLFARQLAIEKGLNIDNPVGLSKVTETF